MNNQERDVQEGEGETDWFDEEEWRGWRGRGSKDEW